VDLFGIAPAVVEDEGVKEAMRKFAKKLRIVNDVPHTNTVELEELKQHLVSFSPNPEKWD
jgi:hypothetical protein